MYSSKLVYLIHITLFTITDVIFKVPINQSNKKVTILDEKAYIHWLVLQFSTFAKHPPWNCDLCLWAQDWGKRIFIEKAALLCCFDNKWSTHDLSIDKPWKGYWEKTPRNWNRKLVEFKSMTVVKYQSTWISKKTKND